MEVLPIDQIRFTEANTYPFIEGYYNLGKFDKGDELLKAYQNNLTEYIKYYGQFDGEKAALVEYIINDKLDALEQVYYLAAYYNRESIIEDINKFYRKLGAPDSELILTQREKDSLSLQGATQQ